MNKTLYPALARLVKSPDWSAVDQLFDDELNRIINIFLCDKEVDLKEIQNNAMQVRRDKSLVHRLVEEVETANKSGRPK